jgi:hypothetical protein
VKSRRRSVRQNYGHVMQEKRKSQKLDFSTLVVSYLLLDTPRSRNLCLENQPMAADVDAAVRGKMVDVKLVSRWVTRAQVGLENTVAIYITW